MITELTQYYREAGILSTEFDCQYYPQCVVGSKALIKGKAAYVGTVYEAHTLPRILFVSKKPPSNTDFETSEKCTPIGVREIESKRQWQDLKSYLHWPSTHRFAVLVANSFTLAFTEKDANNIFAHINTAKCHAEHISNNKIFKNCRHYLLRELEILNPDILIGQGVEANDAIIHTCLNISSQDEYRNIVCIHERILMLSINNHPVLYIRMNMPCAICSSKQERELYPYYLEAIRAFKQFIRPFPVSIPV